MPPRAAKSLHPDQLAQLIPPPVPGLPSIDLSGIAEFIKSGHARHIIVASGAGISTAAGIPDFRSPGTGLYENLQKYNLPTPTAIFDTNYFKNNPEPFFKLASALMPGKFSPCIAHYFCTLLHQKGLLSRCYTQNIDSLERLAGMPDEMLVEAHGTFAMAHCLDCKKSYSFEEIQEELKTGVVLRCRQPDCKGLIKPDLVFFGDDLPARFHELIKTDFPACDLLIVMGTSLLVQPFASVLRFVRPNVPRVLFNMSAVGIGGEEALILKEGFLANANANDRFCFGHMTNRRDVFAGGDCQEAILELVRLLGWEDELWAMVPGEMCAKYTSQA
jgi:NAD-dependent deacetylase sirtuin 2